MPTAPLRPCRAFACGKRVRSGYCSEHQSQVYRQQDEQRGNSTERGYDGTWRRLRARKLATNPLCEICLKKGIVEAAHEVDHKIPISVWPSGRLVWNNLQSLSKVCHSAKTLHELKHPPKPPTAEQLLSMTAYPQEIS